MGKMNNKKVSVIIPFYNGTEWLCEAVQSALDQTYRNVEVIVVNDGSKEDVSVFLEKYGDRIIYRYQENQGSAAARNHAMEIATGDYFAFLDSDDVWLPEKLEKQISFMESVGAKWSHTGFYYWYPQTDELKVVNNFEDYGDIYKKTFVTFRLATLCVIVSRESLTAHPEIRFPIEMRKAQDTHFFSALAKYYPIAYVKEPLAKVRMRKDNSNKQAVLRFNLKGRTYLDLKDNQDVPKGVKRILLIYYIYSKLFGQRTNAFKEKIALAFWSIPYAIERVYVKRLAKKTPEDKKYLKE